MSTCSSTLRLLAPPSVSRISALRLKSHTWRGEGGRGTRGGGQVRASRAAPGRPVLADWESATAMLQGGVFDVAVALGRVAVAGPHVQRRRGALSPSPPTHPHPLKGSRTPGPARPTPPSPPKDAQLHGSVNGCTPRHWFGAVVACPSLSRDTSRGLLHYRPRLGEVFPSGFSVVMFVGGG